MAYEVTGGHRKEGRRHGGHTPMQLLANAVDTYEDSAMARWWEWEAASDGRRQLTWSTGTRDLRALYGLDGLGQEATDEEIAEEDEEADERLVLSTDTSMHVRADQRQCEVLHQAQVGGLDAARVWPADQGLTRPPVRFRLEHR